MADFESLAREKIQRFELRLEECNEAGVRASLGELLIELTLDHGELVVALASRSRPDLYYAAEYVAVMLGAIPKKVWADYQSELNQYVTSNRNDIDPPDSLVDADWLLDWAQRDLKRIRDDFCRNSESTKELEKIVAQYHQPTPPRSRGYSLPTP